MPRALDPGDELVDPNGVVARFVRTTSSDAGAALEIEWEVPVGRRLVAIPHRHPVGPEQFRVEAGTARYRVGWRAGVARAPGSWTVPTNTAHVHPANAGDEPLVVRQSLEPASPDPALTAGVERYFETVFALAADGGVDRFGRVRDPLHDMLLIWENLVPGSYLAGIPTAVQRPLLRAGANLARRRGRKSWLEAKRRTQAGAARPG